MKYLEISLTKTSTNEFFFKNLTKNKKHKILINLNP